MAISIVSIIYFSTMSYTIRTHYIHTHIHIKCVECSSFAGCSFTLTLIRRPFRVLLLTQLLPFSRSSFLFQCFYYGVHSKMQARASDELFYIISVVIFRTCIHRAMTMACSRTTSMGWNDSVIRTLHIYSQFSARIFLN